MRGLSDTLSDPCPTPVEADPLSFDNWWRRLLMATADLVGWPLAFLFVALVEEQSLSDHHLPVLIVAAAAAQLLFGILTGLYRGHFRPFTFEEIGAASLSTGLSGFVVLFTDRIVGGDDPFGHRCVWATATAASLILVARYARRWRARRVRMKVAHSRTPVIVMGAGDGGARVLRAMLHSAHSPYRPVALLDDDLSKRNLSIMGVKVRGTTSDLAAVAHSVDAEAVVLAMPSASPEQLQQLHRVAQRVGLKTLVLPPVQQLVGTGTTAELRSYNDEDVLRRKMVKLDMTAVRELISGRRVLVTGAGGSIGSELSRQLAGLDPAALVLLDHDDSLLHSVHRSIATGPVHQELADIRDPARLADVFGRHQPEIVFHAAALKHVPALEAAPAEGWKTNVLGTRNVLVAAEAAGVRQFVNISTDKAADPVNVLGRTKRIAEQLTAAVAERTGERYVSVRFGNVIGSRGSVMETFQFQIDQGGPVTVTHEDVTRFFMAVREAVRLTLQASTLGSPGEVLVLDMGAPVRIVDVARQLVEQSGREIEIVFTGLRPGEKLHEVLTAPGESASRPKHPLIDHVQVPPAWPELSDIYDPDVAATLVAAVSSGYYGRQHVPQQETDT